MLTKRLLLHRHKISTFVLFQLYYLLFVLLVWCWVRLFLRIHTLLPWKDILLSIFHETFRVYITHNQIVIQQKNAAYIYKMWMWIPQAFCHIENIHLYLNWNIHSYSCMSSVYSHWFKMIWRRRALLYDFLGKQNVFSANLHDPFAFIYTTMMLVGDDGQVCKLPGIDLLTHWCCCRLLSWLHERTVYFPIHNCRLQTRWKPLDGFCWIN